MNRRQLGFGLLTIFIVSLFFGSNTNTSILAGDKIENIGETEVTPAPASDWVQGLGSMTPMNENQAAYLENIADWLVLNAKPASGGLTWSTGGFENRSGYYEGVSGIVSFLAKMYQTTKNATYLETARKAVYWLTTGSGLQVSAGKYKEGDYQPRYYTGLESGASGIGKAFLDMYQVTGNDTYLGYAQEVAWWLLAMTDVVGEGMRWPYKENITITNTMRNPSSVIETYGSTVDLLSNLNTFNAITYDIDADFNTTAYLVDYQLNFNTTDWGLYKLFNLDEESDKFLNYNMQISLRSNVALSPNYSNVSLGGSGPLSWTVVYPSNISTTMDTVSSATTQNIFYTLVMNDAEGSQFRIRIRAAHPTSDFIISVDALNITLSYDDKAYYPDWSIGAAGIGQFFLDLYKVTSNLTYYYTAANASRYLRDVAKAGATGLYWEKQGTGFTSFKDGVAGIGKFLVDLYKVNSSDLIPLNLAIQGANWTLQESISPIIEGFTEDGDSLGSTRRFEYSNKSTQDYRSGYFDGVAGIGDFLLDLASVTAGPNGTLYLTAANETASYLSSNTTALVGTDITLLNITSPYTYRWREKVAVDNFRNGSQGGVAGNLLFLSRYAHLTGSNVIGSVVDGGLRYLTAIPLQWNFSQLGLQYYQGCAGLGDSLLQVSSVAGTAMKAAIGGLNSLLIHENDTQWSLSSIDARVFSGEYQGVAGVGLAFLEGYRSTGNARFLNAATHAAESLSVPSAHYQYSGSLVTYWGKGDGIAGIADFLLEMFVSTGNASYRDWATNILNRLLAVNKGNLDYAYWNLSTADNNFYTTYRDGAAGIASTFLHAFKVTANNTYLRVAKGALVYLDARDQAAGFGNCWNTTQIAVNTYTGWDFGAAGIGSVYLQAFLLTANQTYLQRASGVAFWLAGQHHLTSGSWYTETLASVSASIPFSAGSTGVENFLLQLYAINGSASIYAEIDYGLHYLEAAVPTLSALGWSWGLAGALAVLAQAIPVNRTLVADVLEGGVEYLLTPTFRESSGAWHVNTTSTTVTCSGIANGSAGIFRIITMLPDLSAPFLSISSMDISVVNYYETVPVTLFTFDGFSNIASVFLRVTYNSLPAVKIPATLVDVDYYQAVIPAQAYGTVVSFVVVAMDESGQIAFDDNFGLDYQYVVQDDVDPQYSSIKVMVESEEHPAPAYAQNAKILITATEPSGASQVQSVDLYYSYNGGSFQIMSMVEYPPLSHTYQTPDPGVTGALWCYGNSFRFYFNITDYAGNRVITAMNNTIIQDYTSPMINPYYRMDLSRPEYPAMTSFSITINVSNVLSTCEAPIPIAGGAFILYTKDEIVWTRVNFTRAATYTDFTLYEGTMPGMNMGDLVKFVLCAQDAAGNIVYMDSNKDSYTRFEDIPREMYFYFNVSMNWLLFFLIVAVVGAIVAFSYIIYMRRGGYWQRMRRTASAKATGIAVQAKFAALYYWMLEKFQNLGVKMRKDPPKSYLYALLALMAVRLVGNLISLGAVLGTVLSAGLPLLYFVIVCYGLGTLLLSIKNRVGIIISFFIASFDLILGIMSLQIYAILFDVLLVRLTIGARDAVMGAKGEKGDFDAWLGQKFGEKISKFVRSIGQVIWDFLKGIRMPIGAVIVFIGFPVASIALENATNAVGVITAIVIGVLIVIGGFLVGGGALSGLLKNFITKIRWYQVLLVVLFGLLLILFPVIKWIMDQQYPLRAIFFMGMGIVVFIAGFVVFIMNLIYQISYK